MCQKLHLKQTPHLHEHQLLELLQAAHAPRARPAHQAPQSAQQRLALAGRTPGQPEPIGTGSPSPVTNAAAATHTSSATRPSSLRIVRAPPACAAVLDEGAAQQGLVLLVFLPVLPPLVGDLSFQRLARLLRGRRLERCAVNAERP